MRSLSKTKTMQQLEEIETMLQHLQKNRIIPQQSCETLQSCESELETLLIELQLSGSPKERLEEVR